MLIIKESLRSRFLPQFVPDGALHLPWGHRCVGRMKAVLSRAGVRRRLEQVSCGVLLLLGARLALES